jgi:pimeloyl-ACP methyl ester carboxylesterase
VAERRFEIDLGGRRIEAGLIGGPERTATTLVLLHEGLGSVDAWRDFPEELSTATGLDVLLYSRFGYGRSDAVKLPRPLRYMHDEAALLPDVLRLAGVTRSVLVGHSDGASIAIIAAGSRPELALDGIVLLAPHVFCEDESVQAIERARDDYPALRPRLAKYHANVDNAFWGWNGAWLDPGFRTWNIEEYLGSIRCPVLAVQGEDDVYGTLRQLDAIARGLPRETPFTRVVLPRVGHSLPREAPRETLGAITAFLRR